MKLLFNELSAAKTTTAFPMKAGQTLSVKFSVAGSVDVQYQNIDNWIALQTINASGSFVANGNMVVRLVVTANTGEIDAEII